jgi:hypothetical protein
MVSSPCLVRMPSCAYFQCSSSTTTMERHFHGFPIYKPSATHRHVQLFVANRRCVWRIASELKQHYIISNQSAFVHFHLPVWLFDSTVHLLARLRGIPKASLQPAPTRTQVPAHIVGS